MPRANRLFIFLAAAAIASQLSRAASACIAEFRSTDWQVAQSVLVIVGKVVEVTPEPLPPEAARIFSGGLTKPSTATVEVQRTLRGDTPPKRIHISSGPILSCSPFPVHVAFVPGQSYVFILPEKTGDIYPLTWGGSSLPASDADAVQQSAARCDAWRAEYLERAAKESPQQLKAAEELDKHLAAASAAWPAEQHVTPASLLHGESDDGPVKAAADTVFQSIKNLNAATLTAALALDFGRTARWSRQPVWRQALAQYTLDHVSDITALEHAEWSRLLKQAGATTDQINHYLRRIDQDQSHEALSFPLPLPTLVTLLRGENLTTDFMLRVQAFDRGELYFTYGRDPNALGGLNADRLTKTLPELCRSNFDPLQQVGRAAVAQLPGDTFISLMAEQLAAGESRWADNLRTSPDSEPHWKNIIAHVQKHLDAAAQANFWNTLTTAECFSPECLQEARQSLAEETKDPHPAREACRRALEKYLQAAAEFEKTANSLFPPSK